MMTVDPRLARSGSYIIAVLCIFVHPPWSKGWLGCCLFRFHLSSRKSVAVKFGRLAMEVFVVGKRDRRAWADHKLFRGHDTLSLVRRYLSEQR